MTYQETCEYLYSQLPMFERQGAGGYKEGLENSHALDEHFGHPHKKYLTIHVAGTNGKGSCAHTLSAILQMCGYKVGLYTSPHLVDFSERIRVNGQPIPEDYVVDFVEKEKPFFTPLQPSFFELTTAMAFKYFADMNVDIAVIEVGLGGRLDCTNIITPILSVITNIGMDHMQFLGNSLEEIAMEKAGIIKQHVPVVIGETTPETRQVFSTIAMEKQSPIVFAEDRQQIISASINTKGIEFYTKSFGIISGELNGSYQEKNANTILCAVQQLEALGYMHACKCAANTTCQNREVKQGFAHVCSLTGLKGRWMKVGDAPLTICDTGHNVPGWTYLSKQLKSVQCDHMHIVFGMVDDKDIHGVMELLPINATYYFTKASNKRAVSENVLKLYAQGLGLDGESYPDVKTAYEAAKAAADNNDFVFVGGSSYIVADLLKNCI
ncbi:MULTISPECIES: folylpolyglutamate synthase/dihydrofolate synthase family protein [unclassified Prevotella]|uniref:bifunctional folylpolyglutamate synthase/dihydrofolate synthase n=1 Tax=unclassified Prevotella TaxID=2638335 RepID=UPI00048CC7AE|nr:MULTISPECIES: folylpolyglutamate synthase/dihydrofolate synthase family protein [unclassified Prevotella]